MIHSGYPRWFFWFFKSLERSPSPLSQGPVCFYLAGSMTSKELRKFYFHVEVNGTECIPKRQWNADLKFEQTSKQVKAKSFPGIRLQTNPQKIQRQVNAFLNGHLKWSTITFSTPPCTLSLPVARLKAIKDLGQTWHGNSDVQEDRLHPYWSFETLVHFWNYLRQFSQRTTSWAHFDQSVHIMTCSKGKWLNSSR